MAVKNYDFSGWATKNDIRCTDGRIIRKNAFKDDNGKTVPLVWNHDHNDPDNVLGHAVLENRLRTVRTIVRRTVRSRIILSSHPQAGTYHLCDAVVGRSQHIQVMSCIYVGHQ